MVGREHKVLKDFRVLKEHKVLKVFRELKDYKVLRDFKEDKVLKDFKEDKVLKDYRVLKVQVMADLQYLITPQQIQTGMLEFFQSHRELPKLLMFLQQNFNLILQHQLYKFKVRFQYHPQLLQQNS